MKIIFSAFVFTLLLCSCNNLDRSSAQSIIEKSEKYPHTITGFFASPIRVKRGHPDLYDWEGLKQSGLVKMHLVRTFNDGNDIIEEYSCILTDSGQKYICRERIYENVNKTPIEGDDNSGSVVKLYDVVIKKITGIRENDKNKTALVYYDEEIINETPFAKYIHPSHSLLGFEKVAAFEKYDDGWRY